MSPDTDDVFSKRIRQQLDRHAAAVDELTAARLAAAREQALGLPPEQQERLRKRFDWFRQLPEDKRRALREEWQSMTPEQRQQFSVKRMQQGRQRAVDQ